MCIANFKYLRAVTVEILIFKVSHVKVAVNELQTMSKNSRELFTDRAVNASQTCSSLYKCLKHTQTWSHRIIYLAQRYNFTYLSRILKILYYVPRFCIYLLLILFVFLFLFRMIWKNMKASIVK
jgi:hypothetical protein